MIDGFSESRKRINTLVRMFGVSSLAFKKHEVVLASLAIMFLLALNALPTEAAAPNPAAPYLPSFSIYGAPSTPSSVAVLNDSSSLWAPYVHTIYFTWFTTSEAVIEALVNGYIQFDDAGVSNVQEYNQLQPYIASGQVAINISAGDTFGYIGFNTNKGLEANVHFRRALQHLMNYASETQVLDNGILGIASPYYLLPQIYGSYFGASEQAAYQQYGAFSVSAAEQELTAAGLTDNSHAGYWTFTSNGTRVPAQTIYTSSGATVDLEEAEIESMSSNANAINLTITIVPVDFNTLIGSLLPSGSLEMYYLGWSLGTPINPTWLYAIFGNYPLNTFYQDYINQTIWNQVYTLQTASTTEALATQYTITAATELQTQLPYIIMTWGSSLSPVDVHSWKGYTLESPYGLLFPGEIHPANATFGGLYRFGTPSAPDGQNIYIATSLYDFQILEQEYVTPLSVSPFTPTGIIGNAAYNYTVGSGHGKDPNGHNFNGTIITMNFLPNAIFQDGVPETAADYNFTIWYLDLGGFSANPYNPSSDTVTIDPGVTVNYTAEASNPGLEYFGESPTLVDSYVPPSNPYQLQIFFNSTSVFNLQTVYGEPILPEHTLASVAPTTLATESASQYFPQEVWSGAYSFDTWNQANSYAQLSFFPGYFLANPLDIQMNAQAGSTAPFSMTADTWNGAGFTANGGTYQGAYAPINGASGTLYVVNPSTLAPIANYPLTAGSNGVYTANIPTGSLAVGSYTLLAELSWTGASYPAFAGSQTTGSTYYYHQYSTLNVTPKSTQSTSQTSTSSSISAISFSNSVSTTVTASSQSSVSNTGTTTSSGPTTTTTTSSNTAEYLVLALVVIAVVIALVALVMRRGSKSSPAM